MNSIPGIEFGEIANDDMESMRSLRRLLTVSIGVFPQVLFEETLNTVKGGKILVSTVSSPEGKTVVGCAMTVALKNGRSTSLAVRYLTVDFRWRQLGIATELVRRIHCYAIENLKADIIYALRPGTRPSILSQFGYRTVTSMNNTCGLELSSLPTKMLRALCAPSVTVPDALKSGDVTLRFADQDDKKNWKAVILSACDFNMGGIEMVQLTLQAQFRVVIVPVAKPTEICALVCVKDADGWVPFIASDVRYRRMGYGAYLLHVAMEWIRLHGGNEIRLTPLSTKVCRFYDRWGFVDDAEDVATRRNDEMPPPRKRKKASAERVMVRSILPRLPLLPKDAPLGNLRLCKNGAFPNGFH